MFNCFVCHAGKQMHFADSNAFLAHIQLYHSNLVVSGNLICTHVDCIGRQYDKFNSFRKHVKTHKSLIHAPLFSHGTVVPVNEASSPMELVQPTEAEKADEQCEKIPVRDTPLSLANFDVALINAVVSFIANMYDSGLTATQVQTLIANHRQLLSDPVVSVLESTVLSLLASCNVPEADCKHVSRMFRSLANMFDGFETSRQRLNEFQRCKAYIAPEPFTIGAAKTERTVDDKVVLEPITLSGQFIPIRKVLKGFLELPGVFKTIIDYMEKLEASEAGVMENIVQAKLWQQKIKPLFPGKTVLPLNFFFDDYETNKALGSHAGVHNLGAGYVRLPCLPPQYQGGLENIFLCVLFHSNDKAFGNKKIFRKVVTELSYLEKSGIFVVTPEGTFQVFFSLCVCGGDNKGANEILGYVQGFTANFFCRVCCMHRDLTAKQTVADPSMLRTPNMYEAELALNDPSKTGRKEECVFNELGSFHVYENFHLDVMHDFDEGQWKYVMTDIVRYFLKSGTFTLVQLNELVQGFLYGAEERNKPPLILADHVKQDALLKFSASEMRCFTRYFGLMIGHLIPEHDQVWKLYLIARTILDIVTAPRIRESDCALLKKLIDKHHKLFKSNFKKTLKPKFHFGTHVPEVMLSLGPLEPLSCIRIEAKHREGVQVAQKSRNRINLPLTVAKHHQLMLAFRLLSGRGLVAKFECSRVQITPLHCISNYVAFLGAIPPDYSTESWNTVKWVKVNGTMYREKSVILMSVLNGNPCFGTIHTISVKEGNKVFIIARCLETVLFSTHFHAYEVKSTSEFNFVHLNDLATHAVSDIRIGLNGKMYVPLRFSISNV